MEKVTINGGQYLFKASNYALGVTLRRTGESLETVNSALKNIDFLYEYIYQTIKFSYSVADKKFKFADNKFKFFAELDSDQKAIEQCFTIISESFQTDSEDGDEDAVVAKKKEDEQ